MKVARDRYGRPLHAEKEPAWMKHAKAEKNGYIFRTETEAGYRIYCADIVPYYFSGVDYSGLKANRRIQLSDDFGYRSPPWRWNCWNCYGPDGRTHKPRPKPEKAKSTKKTPNSEPQEPRERTPVAEKPEPPKSSSQPLVTDDPVEDGRSLATSDVPLPSHTFHKRAARGVSLVPMTAEEREIEELYRTGMLYDSETQAAEVNLASIDHEQPTYAIRVVARRKGKKRSGKQPVRVREEIPILPLAEACDCWRELLEAEGWELGPFDDDMSVAGSWVLMDDSDADSTLGI
ncbi:hypothetical protein GQ53DRAFT_741140 [Thozetella sp. PMI_491]|nr:hypothetical protein GQ53DRAFT_741140 [Thozetella sp. PMI_491]